MEEFISKVWKLIDLQFPLIVADMETYLLREGNISQEDYNKIKSIIKSVKNAYYSSDFNKLKIYLKDGLEQLKSIQPKKNPFLQR